MAQLSRLVFARIANAAAAYLKLIAGEGRVGGAEAQNVDNATGRPGSYTLVLMCEKLSCC